MSELLLVDELPTAEVQPDNDRPTLGTWWWVTAPARSDTTEDSDVEHDRKYDEPGRKWLGCVIEVGSNYVELKGVRLTWRVSLDKFPDCCVVCDDADAYISERVKGYQGNVRELMGEIHRVCALLGVSPRQALAESSAAPSTALAIAHGEADIKQHSKALTKAKTETLPELFKKVEHQHALMATWMKAQIIPSSAELSEMQGSIGLIEKRIHTVELYAGLTEQLEQIKKGKPAPNDTKVSVFQRRLYMDEECLVDYRAGGMNFERIEAFDEWLLKPHNLNRILPKTRSIVAFRVRRNAKKYDLNPFIAMSFAKADEWTFLYIRNGEQVWRMTTSIDFGARLFPSKEDSDLLGDKELWVAPDFKDGYHSKQFLITERQREAWRLTYLESKTNHEIKLREYKATLPAYRKAQAEYKIADKKYDAAYEAHRKITAAWHAADEATRGDYPTWDQKRPESPTYLFEPHFYGSDDWKRYEKLTPYHIYFDDAMKQVGEAAHEHNRVAVILQGLLDRSTCLHPHPPWKIWTAEGFTAGIESIFDDEYALTPGDAPDFNAYRAQLAKSLKIGSYVIGHKRVWMDEVQEREQRENGHNHRNGVSDYWRPPGNKGPRTIAKIDGINKRGARFSWKRDAQRSTKKVWIESETRPGWGHYERQYGDIDVVWYCKSPEDKLFNVSAYTPGDFHLFYDDPRTRANYLQWAPFLLRAEDWHAEEKAREHIERKDLDHDHLDDEPKEPDEDDDD